MVKYKNDNYGNEGRSSCCSKPVYEIDSTCSECGELSDAEENEDITVETIMESLANGQRKQMVQQITNYDDFFKDFEIYLNENGGNDKENFKKYAEVVRCYLDNQFN